MRIIIGLLFFVSIASAQTINDFKYAVVPTRFEIQKKDHQYGLNELTKKYFQKLGFTAAYDNEPLPAGLPDGCDRLSVDVVGDNTMFRTALKVVLRDCRNVVVHETSIFKDKNKDNHIAFTHALRDALKTLDTLNYKYSGKATEQVVQSEVIFKEDFDADPNLPVLNAQPIENGYQLVDTTPKIVLRMYKTSQPEVYAANDGTSNGVVFRSNGRWIYEYFVDGKKLTRDLNIKF